MMTRMMVMMMTRMVMMMRMREEEERRGEEKVLGQKSNNPNLKGGEKCVSIELGPRPALFIGLLD